MTGLVTYLQTVTDKISFLPSRTRLIIISHAQDEYNKVVKCSLLCLNEQLEQDLQLILTSNLMTSPIILSKEV